MGEANSAGKERARMRMRMRVPCRQRGTRHTRAAVPTIADRGLANMTMEERAAAKPVKCTAWQRGWGSTDVRGRRVPRGERAVSTLQGAHRCKGGDDKLDVAKAAVDNNGRHCDGHEVGALEGGGVVDRRQRLPTQQPLPPWQGDGVGRGGNNQTHGKRRVNVARVEVVGVEHKAAGVDGSHDGVTLQQAVLDPEHAAGRRGGDGRLGRKPHRRAARRASQPAGCATTPQPTRPPLRSYLARPAMNGTNSTLAEDFAARMRLAVGLREGEKKRKQGCVSGEGSGRAVLRAGLRRRRRLNGAERSERAEAEQRRAQ